MAKGMKALDGQEIGSLFLSKSVAQKAGKTSFGRLPVAIESLGYGTQNIALTIFLVTIEVAGGGGWLQLLHRHNAVFLNMCFYIGGSVPICDVLAQLFPNMVDRSGLS